MVEQAGKRQWGGLTVRLVVALAVRVVREVGGHGAQRAARRLPVLGLDSDIRLASAADRAAFADELTTAVTRPIARYRDEQAPTDGGSD